jgi:hypothetical protein
LTSSFLVGIFYFSSLARIPSRAVSCGSGGRRDREGWVPPRK